MKKQVLIVTDEGVVRINDVPNTVKKDVLVEIARLELFKLGIKPWGYQYLVNSKMFDWVQEHYKKDEFPTYTVVVDYEEVGK